MSRELARSQVEIADGLRLTIGRIARRLRQQSLGGLTPSQRSVLDTLHRHGPMTMSELADHERISRPSATGIVGRLTERGLLQRSPASEDGRSTVVSLSPEAIALIDRTGRERTAFLAEALARLDPDDLATLDRTIEIFADMLGEER